MKKKVDWKKKLSDEQYRVLRKGSTELPFTGKLLHNKQKGNYHCSACGAKLFGSDAKFDSGTGWPSFDKATDNVAKRKQKTLLGTQTEAYCKKCGGHLGHVFGDGPKETTGKRFCINSVCLDFKKKPLKRK